MADSTVKVVIQGVNDTNKAFSEVRTGLASLAGSILGQAGGMKIKDGFNEAVAASNTYQNSLTGLDSVSQHFTGEQDKARQAALQLASDGLMPVSDAATSLKNLLATGFSLPEATQMMERFKDMAAFGRQGSLDFGEAIRTGTEGIKNGNSILLDNMGLTKNGSIIMEEAGASAQDFGRLSQDAGLRQKFMAGAIRESNAQLGDAAKLSSNFSGAQSKLGTVIFSTKAQVGDLLKSGVAPLMTKMTEWLTNNKQVVVSMALAGGAVLGFLTLLIGGAGLVRGIMSVASALGGPLTLAFLAISLLAGGVVFSAMQKLQDKMLNTAKTTADSANKTGKTAQDGYGEAGKAAGDLAKKLGDIDKSALAAERDFRESLARMVQDHEKKVSDLKGQIDDENASTADANKSRETDYTKSLQQMKDEHEKKTRDIGQQLDQESAKGFLANRQTVDDLNQRLAEENQSYQQHYDEVTQQYTDDTAKAQTQHDTKLTALQVELDAENALLSKHADDIRSVRNVTLLDEIDNLKRSHDEQMKSFDQQRADARESSKKTTQAQADESNKLPDLINKHMLDGVGADIGRSFARAIADALFSAWGDIVNSVSKFVGAPGGALGGALGTFVKGLRDLPSNLHYLGIPGFDSGGFTGTGGAGDVAGFVHRGEYVVPKSGVDQQTGLPKAMGGGVNVTQHIYNQVDMDAGFADVAWRQKFV